MIHGSIHIWVTNHLRGILQATHPASPQGICLLSTPNNQFPTSLQKSYNDQICILLKQGRKVEEGFGYPMGEL